VREKERDSVCVCQRKKKTGPEVQRSNTNSEKRQKGRETERVKEAGKSEKKGSLQRRN
jgi:hypothetical protein